MKVGQKVKVLEHTVDGTYEWVGVITEVTKAYVETKHARNRLTHPQWDEFRNAYVDTWTKHYFHPDNVLSNIKELLVDIEHLKSFKFTGQDHQGGG